MTTYHDILPTHFVCADDLKGKDHTLIIKAIDFNGETWLNGHKTRAIILYFEKAHKGLVLNVTNHNLIAFKLGYGKQLEHWVGKPITLYPTTDPRVRGDDKDVVRVRSVVTNIAKPDPTADPAPEPDTSPIKVAGAEL